mgnify:CR=1 FL=1
MENFLDLVGTWAGMFAELPWYGMLITAVISSVVVTHVVKLGKNVCGTVTGAVKTTAKVVAVPFKMAKWAIHLVVPEDINTRYKGAKSLTIKDILALNTHFAKNGTNEVDSDLLVLFVNSLDQLRDAKGRKVRVRDLDGYFGKKNALNGEISRPVLELTTRGDARADDLISRFSDTDQIAEDNS